MSGRALRYTRVPAQSRASRRTANLSRKSGRGWGACTQRQTSHERRVRHATRVTCTKTSSAYRMPCVMRHTDRSRAMACQRNTITGRTQRRVPGHTWLCSPAHMAWHACAHLSRAWHPKRLTHSSGGLAAGGSAVAAPTRGSFTPPHGCSLRQHLAACRPVDQWTSPVVCSVRTPEMGPFLASM